MEKNSLSLSLKVTSINKLPLVLMFCTLLFIVLVVINSGKKLVVYNHTSSLPKGFYRLTDLDLDTSIRNGELVVFDIPASFRKMVIERKWLNKNDTLTKPVSAIEGDFVCTHNRTVTVNNISYGRVKMYDSEGRPMPWFKYCGTVKKGDVFVFINNAKSFDSRYYGPVNVNDIHAKARPLWIF